MKSTQNISQAADALRAGELVAFPTETVYGLGADAGNDEAVAQIFSVKKRPQFNPLIVHVTDLKTAQKFGTFNDDARALAAAFWPGPLTLVVARKKNCPISRLASAGLESLAIRVPAHQLTQTLLSKFDGPVVAPSANPSGSISPTTATHVINSLEEKVSMVLDGGPCKIGLESTIVSCLGDQPEILRQGGITETQIKQIVSLALHKPNNTQKPTAPGQLLSHYAPKATLRLNVLEPDLDEIYIGFGEHNKDATFNLSETGDLNQAAATLFSTLHETDKMGAEKLAIAPIPNVGIGQAINDRLKRAAAPRNGEMTQ